LTGPERFVSIDGESVIIHTPRGRKLFRSTVVNPWTAGTHESHNKSTRLPDDALHSLDMTAQEHVLPSPDEQSPENHVSSEVLRAMFGESNLTYVSDTTGGRFAESRLKELKGLEIQGMF
jgi:hypothetical protein